jgi:hypothetical protein
MRLTLHRIVLICLIKIAPKLFKRYLNEYLYTYEQYYEKI